MTPEIYQTKDEQDVLKIELDVIKEQFERGDLTGELAEVGVMWGGSAKLIKEIFPDSTWHLFDTFTGLPNTIKDGVDPEHYMEGDMMVDYERVKRFFKDDKEVYFHQGIFPQETGKVIEGKRFAFVHIDVDIYQSTRDAMLALWSLVNINGSIMVHDYPAHNGVKKAIDELFDGVGTFYVGKWKERELNPMYSFGSRQLVIRKRIEKPLNLYVEKPEVEWVYKLDKKTLKQLYGEKFPIY